MKLTLIVVSIFIGMLMPIQGSLNARLGQALNHPLHGALVNFVIGLIAIFVFCLLIPVPIASVKKVFSLPWHYLLGGICGAIFVTAAVLLIPKIGATSMVASFIVGQLAFSLIIDHFGLFSAPVKQVTLQRLSGVLMLFVSLFLITK